MSGVKLTAAVALFLAGLFLSSGWIAVAHAIGVDAWTRAWWAGSIAGSLNTCGLLVLCRSSAGRAALKDPQ